MSACKDCRYWNTEPFETQCDGVTPVEGDPQMGCCMCKNDTGCTRPEMGAFCPNYVSRPALTNVCMFCHRIIGPDSQPYGKHIKDGSLVSHGVCILCAPGYCAQLGLSEHDTARVLAASNISPSPVNR